MGKKHQIEIDGREQTISNVEKVYFPSGFTKGQVIGFCWVVLFDPGTGLEGEVAEVYVSPEHRGHGVGEVLIDQATQLFRDRAVTLGYVWTRPDNKAAVHLYESAGFERSRQLVLTWYPTEANLTS